MPRVLVGIGSNIDRHRHVTAALDALSLAFGDLAISSVYESEAVGFAGDPFYNLVVAFDADLGVAALSAQLREIENANGRRRGELRFAARTLDIDILTWSDATGVVDGVVLPRPEILANAFVLLPLAELLPDTMHPEAGVTYAALWARYDQTRQVLRRIDFDWRGRALGKEPSRHVG